MAKSACAELKGKIRPNDICAVVQPGQVIELSIPKKDPNIWKIETLAWYQWSEWFEKHTDPSGKVTYMLDGKEIPKIQKWT